MPRPTLFIGLVSGLSAAIGYGIGVLISKTIRWTLPVTLSKNTRKIAWQILATCFVLFGFMFLFLGLSWQNEVRYLVGVEPVESQSWVLSIILIDVFFLIFVQLGRGIAVLLKGIQRQLDRCIPRRVSIVASASLTGLIIYGLISGVLLQTALNAANNFYGGRNVRTPEDIIQPSTALRSGSPESLVAWDDVGWQGKRFVGSGPTPKEISDFNGTDAKEPIRIYAGLRAKNSAKERAELAVAELKRTNAFERKVLVLATTTGGGWLEPQAVDSIEYMFSGDTAIVAQQYSYLPSWMVFLVEPEASREAGRALYEAVYAEWVKLPENKRPKLVAYGLSLGSFGAQAAYAGIQDIRSSIDGALFVGTPSDTELWNEVTDNRDKGTPQWLPTYEGGKTVRFAAKNEDITTSTADWTYPRVLYTQHASDPVIWFSFDLLFQRPDWTREPRGTDVSPRVHWYPIVSFLQIGVDQFFGTNVPVGHGHNYSNLAVRSWAALVTPDGWSEERASRLQALIDEYPVP